MSDKQLHGKILGVSSPWTVTGVDLRLEQGDVKVMVEHDPVALSCPECERVCRGYDTHPRQWRHLDTCQYRTILSAEVPHIKCPPGVVCGR